MPEYIVIVASGKAGVNSNLGAPEWSDADSLSVHELFGFAEPDGLFCVGSKLPEGQEGRSTISSRFFRGAPFETAVIVMV